MSAPLVVTAPARRSAARGWWGIALFVATEATLFGTIFGTYFYLRVRSVSWPPQGIPEPRVVVPAILTGVLLATSGLMVLAYRAGRTGRPRAACWWLVSALTVQSGYFAMQVHLFADDVRSYPPRLNAYASISHLMVGAGHLHALAGLLLDLFLLAKLLDGRITGYRLTGLRAAALYWHFVNVITLLVLGVELSARL